MSTASEQIPSSSLENSAGIARKDSPLMRRLKVRYRYYPSLAPNGREYNPKMHVFLSQNVKPEDELVKVFYFTKEETENISGMKTNDNEKLKDHFHGIPSVSTTDSTTSISSKLKTKNTKKLKEELSNDSSINTDAWYNKVDFNKEVIFDWKSEKQLARTEEEEKQPKTLKIDRDTTLNFYAFTHTYNNKGEMCVNEAGSCSVYLWVCYILCVIHTPLLL